MRRVPGGLSLALAASAGFLAGVVLVAALGGAKGVTRTVTERAAAPGAGVTTTAGTVVVRTVVPDLAGQPLDVAEDRLSRARFEVDVRGGGLFGVIDEANWEVTGQDPPPGTFLEQGSTVHVDVERR